MSRLLKQIQKHNSYQKALELERRQSIALYGMTAPQRAFFVATLANKKAPLLYVAENHLKAREICNLINALLPGSCCYMPPKELLFSSRAVSPENKFERINALEKIRSNNARVLVICPETLMEYFQPTHGKLSFDVAVGETMEPQEMLRRLIGLGYERVDMVEGRGQCALRGDILDVFPPNLPNPVRIDFFDREIDAMRSFDVVSQRSDERLSSLTVIAAREYLLSDSERIAAADKMEAMLSLAIDRRSAGGEDIEGLLRLKEKSEELRERGAFSGFSLFAPLLTQDYQPLLNTLSFDRVIVDTPNNLQKKLDDKLQTYLADLSSSLLSGEAIQEQEAALASPEDVLDSLKDEAVILVQDILRGTLSLKPAAISCQGKSVSQYASRFQKLREDIERRQRDGYVIRLFSESGSRCERIQRSLESLHLLIDTTDDWDSHSKPVIVQKAFPHGFLWEDAKILLLGESDLYGHSLRRTKKKTTAGARLESFVDLKPGDYVVHEAHGIGRYQGTVRLQSEGTWRDYLLIFYKGSDKLYVPVDQFDRVQKYIGSLETPPPLNDLTGNAWQRQKSRVRASVKQLAFNLVELYAKRQATPGYAFTHPGIFENEFADRFEYELTEDQQRAIGEVLHDMEKPVNMDRLLCGDVGYGKTEVAMRAAFRAVMGAKQVAVLAPTTILVKQHEKTFRERFQVIPVEIASVSRFNTAKETREILAKLHDKKIDILIGTHRLLSKDVRFADLGLLIIDEEQRFGVANKEKIQSMKQTVDVLTLSATPIPRTLNMSMIGVRDMSLLETPPENRLPVQTYVMDYSDAIVRGAITRELNRDGQVFFLYNRVQNIEKFAARLATLLPDTKIGIAHGQMSAAALEDVMNDFYRQKLDVLVCSTIIENGLDVPSANTLMVYDADMFGLSQLYQLRGRVGRSWQSAYAYFFVRPDKALTQDAQKRLAAIQEFTEFGAGFRIAMRDLEIRGAGNMFGPEQSGQIASVGYDMYWKLIEEAIREAKGGTQATQVEKETRVELPVDAFLPESYVSGDKQRIEVYKRIASVTSKDDLDELTSDLVDRFGEPPEPVVTLSLVSYLRHLASTIGSDLVSFGSGYLSARLNENYVQSPERLVRALSVDKRLSLSPGRSTTLRLQLRHDSAKGALKEGIRAYEKLIDAMRV